MWNVSELKKVLTVQSILFQTSLCLPGAFFFFSFYWPAGFIFPVSLRAATHVSFEKVSPKPAVRSRPRSLPRHATAPDSNVNVWTIILTRALKSVRLSQMELNSLGDVTKGWT